MNPVGEAGNIFSSLFEKVPAKRPGNEEDIASAVLYLASRAGVSCPYLHHFAFFALEVFD